MLSRRSFLGASLGTLAGAAAGPLLTGCAPVQRPAWSALVERRKACWLPRPSMELLGHAALAPSSHNAQPWKVRARSAHDFAISLDASRRLPEVDPRDREAVLSLAAFLENLVQASTALGFAAQPELVGAAAGDPELFRVRLMPARPRDGEVLGLMRARATSRSRFDARALDTDDVRRLVAVDPEHLLYLPRQSRQGRWIVDTLPEAIRQQAHDDRKQAELSHWLRFSRSEARERGDGLTPEALGISRSGRLAWYGLFSRDTAMSGSFRASTVEAARDQLEGCAGFLLVTSEDDSLAALVEAGRVFERVWLLATRLGVAQHPMSQLLEEAPWAREIGSELGLGGPVQYVVRVGYAKAPGRTSLRRPVCDCLTVDGAADPGLVSSHP